MIKLGLYTGQRLGAVAALTWSNIDLERDIIRLTTRKTGKPIAVPRKSKNSSLNRAAILKEELVSHGGQGGHGGNQQGHLVEATVVSDRVEDLVALAFVGAGFGVAVVSEPLQKIPAGDVIFRDLAPEDRAWMPVGAAWKPEALTAPVASQFIEVLAQSCGNGNGGVVPLRTVA